MTDDTRHTISESADKIVLKTEIKRGSDTRDQDKINVKVKGDDPEDVAERLQRTVVAIQEQGTPSYLRETQPTDDGGEK